MSDTKKTSRRSAKGKSAREDLSPMASSYNRLQNRAETRFRKLAGLCGIAPLGVGISIMPFVAADSSMASTVGLIAVSVSALSVVVLSRLPDRGSDAIARIRADFYRSAGIERESDGWDRLEPGKLLESFDHTFEDGRSGKIEVICDSAGTPQILFREIGSATFIGDPILDTTKAELAKELTA